MFKLNEKLIIECKATMKMDDRKQTANLRSVKSANKHNHNENIEEIDKNKMPSINWYKETEMLQPVSNRTDITTEVDNGHHNLHSVLTIHHSKIEDCGKYRCVYDDIQEQVDVRVSNYESEFEIIVFFSLQ